MSALRELLAAFDIEVKDEALKRVQHGLDEAKEAATGFGEKLESLKVLAEGALAFLGVERAAEFVEHTAAQADAVGDLSNALGVNSSTLQVWQELLIRSGGSAESAGALFRTLATNVEEASKGGKEAVSAFKDIGIEAADLKGLSLDEVLSRVGEGLADMGDATERAAVGSKLLGRSVLSILPAFGQGSEALRDLLGELDNTAVVFDEEFIKQADEAEKVSRELSATVGRLGVAFSKLLLPVIDLFEEKLIPIIDEFGKIISDGDRVRAILIAIGVTAIPTVVTALISLYEALAPLLPEIAGIVASTAGWLLLAAVIEDLVVLFEGGDSEIGHLLDTMFGVGAATAFVDTLTDAWRFLVEVIWPTAKDVFGALVEFFSHSVEGWALLIQDFGSFFKAVFNLLPDSVQETITLMTRFFSHFFDWVGDKMANLVPQGVRDLAKGLFDTINDKANAAARAEARGQALGGQVDTFGNFTPTAPPGTTPGTTNATTLTDNRRTEIHVHGATSPGETARETAGAVNDANAHDRTAILAGVK